MGDFLGIDTGTVNYIELILLQETRLIIHVVSQPNQVNQIHYMAQLQMDYSKNSIFHISHSIHCPFLLFSSRLHN